MAQLKIDVIVDDNGAAQKLQQIEAATRGVESAGAAGAASLGQSASAAKAASAAHGELASASSLTARAFQGLRDYTANVSTAFQNFEASAQAVASKGLTNMSNALTSMKTLMVGLPIAAMISDFIHTASAIDDMSLKTGIGVVALGRFKYAGELVGISLEQISSAVVKLQDKLSSGDKSAVASINELGLNFQMLQGLDPAQQFEVIAGALGRVQNQGDMARIAIDLFGRGGATLIPLFKQNLQALGDEGERFGAVMSQDVVSAGDQLGDMLYKVYAAGKNLVALPIVEAVDTWSRAFRFFKLDEATAAMGRFVGVARMAFAGPVAGAKLPGAPDLFAGQSIAAPEIDHKAIEQELAEQNRALNAAAKEQQRAADEWRKFKDSVSGQDKIDSADKMARAIREIGVGTALSADKMKDFHELLTAAIPAAIALGSAGPSGPIRGLLEAGNIDLKQRPMHRNEDGSISTVRSMSFNQDDKEILVPTISEDGRVLTEEEAIAAYQATGRHLGIFTSEKNATAYAQRLHVAQDQYYGRLRRYYDQWVATMPPLNVTNGITPGQFGQALALPTVPQIPIPSLPKVTNGLGDNVFNRLKGEGTLFGESIALPNGIAERTVSPFRQAFSQLGKDLPGIVFGALQGGGNVAGSVASAIGAQFAGQFQKALQAAGGDISKVSGGNKALGIAGASVGAAFTGFSLGQQLGKGKGALAGAAAGAMAGSVVPGIGTAIGAGVGAIAGWFGGRSKDKADRKAMEEMRADMLEQYGGMAKLQAKAKELGLDMTKAFNTKKPAEFRTEVEKLNAALEAHAKSPAGMAEARYKSTADLQAEAQQAVDIWSYMSTSGKYSASVVQQAWDDANSALIASGDKQALAAQAANQAVSDLSAKILGLQQTYANEAPEEVMGVVEAQARAQVAALEEQRNAAKANIDAIKADLQPLVDGGIKIPVDFWVRSGVPGMSAQPAPGSGEQPEPQPGANDNYNGGGDYGSYGYRYTGEGQYNNGDYRYHFGGEIKRLHRGGLASDEVPLIGQTGEFMISRRGVAAAGLKTLQRINRGDSAAGGTATIVVNLDGRTVIEQIVPYLPGELQRLGLVP